MGRSKKNLLLLLILTVLSGVVYWQDPWLWRRLINTFAQLGERAPFLLEPNETVYGDGSLVLPVANDRSRSISDGALKSAESFAASVDSYALLIVHRGVIQSEWYADGWDRESLTQSQSMHKTLLALQIGVALERGLIESVNDPLSRYIPEWRSDPRGNITLFELMEMSSGLALYKFTLNPFTDDFRWLFSGNSVPVLLQTPTADWRPGEKFEYNDINAELLGLVLENAFGKRYAELLSENVWQPLGATPAKVWLDHEGGKAHTSCCLMATARDWARVGLLMQNRGQINGKRIVGADWIATMTSPAPVSKWYGMQTWLAYAEEMNPRSEKPSAAGSYWRSEPFLAPDIFYFSGHGAQRVYVVPSRQLVIVRIGPAFGPKPLKPGWDNSYLVNTAIRGIKLPASNAAALVAAR